MKLTILQSKALYEELLEINEENINGMFFVSSVDELEEQAIQFLKYEDYDLEDVVLEFRWNVRGYTLFGVLIL